MRYKFVFLLIAAAFLLNLKTFAQTGRQIKGTVKDSTGATLPGTTVKIITGTDSTTVVTDTQGSFTFNDVKVNQFSLVLNSIGYQALKRRYILDNDTKPVALAPIILKTDTYMLGTVTVSDVNPVKLKEDTIEFNVDAYKVRENAPVEDVIKKLPGVDVDKDGNITAQGKSVTKVRVNGKDFFGGDVKSATKNLPADIVQNIQIIDDYGDQANITGVKSGEPDKVLNITIKESKNYGYFGQASVGGGRDAIPGIADSKEGTRYVASANVFSFSGSRQLAFLGNLNNTNNNLFTFNGGGPRGGGPGGPPGSNNATNGITTARSFGLNYRDSWGKKITVYGSYSFADNSVYTVSNTIQNNISTTNPSINTSGSTQNDDKLNHRFNFNIEYKPDTVNYIKITPSIAYARVNTTQTGNSILINNAETISNYNFNTLTNQSEPNYGVNVLFNHRFNSHGLNFSVNVGAGSYRINKYQNPVYTYIDGARNAPLNQYINTNSRTDSVGTTLSFLQPLSKKGYLELTYAYHYAHTTADKLTDTLADNGDRNQYDLLSNNYNSTFITNRFGLNYRFIDKKYNYTLGVVAQPSILRGQSLLDASTSTNISTFNFAPNARFIYNFSRSQSISLNYNGSSSSPTYTELQPVTDFSNASYPVQGNPDLKPEFNNNLSLKYNKFDFESGNVFFSNLSFITTNNKIVANTINYPKVYIKDSKLAGTILTQYQNADGYYSAQGFYVFAKPWDKRKYNLFFIGNVAYNNNISYISNVDSANYLMTTEKNIAKNLVLSQGVRFRVSIADIVDAEASTTYSLNKSDNSISEANVNNNFSTLNLGVNGKNYLWKDWTVSYDYSKVIYYGYKGATNPNILNTYIERRFLKGNTGTIRLSAMDVFNQNTGYTSTQSGSYVTQVNSNRLGRYYLLSFTLKLQKFAGKKPNMGPGGPGGGPPPGSGPGGPPPF